MRTNSIRIYSIERLLENGLEMAKREKTRRTRRRDSRRDQQRSPASVVDALLHSQTPDERPWKFLLPVLVLAFVVRAAIALCGDFVLHPDEIMQYLEPAHRLVFGNGVTYWEFFYGARAWLVPGVVAGMLKVFDFVGLGEPVWYVGGVKLMFCAISLLIPVGMYFFARRHFGETSARVALLAGAFWYELVGFAHKPMTEFVATALLMVLLALCVRSSADRVRTVWIVALVVVLMAAVRVQYAPLALLLLGVFFFRTEKKVQLVVASIAFLLAVGVFDAITWDGGLFHSYITNIRFNLLIDEGRAGETPGIPVFVVAFARECRVECAVYGHSTARSAALRVIVRPHRSGVAYPFCTGTQGVPVRFCGYSAVACDWGGCGGASQRECARLGIGGGFVRGGIAGWDSECVALSGSGVSRFFQRDGKGGVYPRSGSDFCGVSLPGPHIWRSGGVAG